MGIIIIITDTSAHNLLFYFIMPFTREIALNYCQRQRVKRSNMTVFQCQCFKDMLIVMHCCQVMETLVFNNCCIWLSIKKQISERYGNNLTFKMLKKWFNNITEHQHSHVYPSPWKKLIFVLEMQCNHIFFIYVVYVIIFCF